MQEMPFSDSHHAISRRRFIRNAAIAGAAPLVIPAGSLAKEGEEGKRVAMGFVGMGTQNRGLMRNFIRQPDVSVVAVCDVDTTRREHALKTVRDYYAERAKRRRTGKGAKLTTIFKSWLAVTTSTLFALRHQITGTRS